MGDGVGDLLPGDPEGNGIMSRVGVRPSDRVTGGALTVPSLDW